MGLLLLDMQRALYLWSNSSRWKRVLFLSQVFAWDCAIERSIPWYCLISRKDLKQDDNLRFLTLFQWDITGRKLERVFSPRTCSGKRDQTHVTEKRTNDNFVIFCLRWKGDSTWLKPLRSPQPKFWTSQSRSLSSNWFFECEHPFIDKPMVITVSAVPSTQLYPSNMLCMFNKDLTRFMQYDKFEQAIERLCWQGVVSTEYIVNQKNFNKYYAKEAVSREIGTPCVSYFFRSRSQWLTFFVLKTILVNPSKNRVLISLYALVYKKDFIMWEIW